MRPNGLQPTRLLYPWDFPGKSTGVGCHCLLRRHLTDTSNWSGYQERLIGQPVRKKPVSGIKTARTEKQVYTWAPYWKPQVGKCSTEFCKLAASHMVISMHCHREQQDFFLRIIRCTIKKKKKAPCHTHTHTQNQGRCVSSLSSTVTVKHNLKIP